uniref:Ig-like domain-containing protein n=1 Tax=Urocitellus parryii TaxID=9999 RepID=A0A8D2GJ42_UROPR
MFIRNIGLSFICLFLVWISGGSVFYNDVLHFPGVVTQETSLTTTPGGTVTLTCGSSTGAITISNYAGWVQQKPYQVSQGLIGSTSNRFPGVPASYSGSLLSRGAQTEDEATYYCALWFSNHFHRETHLLIILCLMFSKPDKFTRLIP